VPKKSAETGGNPCLLPRNFFKFIFFDIF
jgi:hypothetical protein